MAVMIPVKDGEIVDTSASSNSLSADKKTSNSSLDKEAFLQLLVAQMKYQDPLEPTSNTEYISQLATFSSLEEMQNLNATMTSTHASNLVGKDVIMRVTGKTGDTSFVAGRVDYIERENGKTYVSIDGSLYNVDDLYQVIDSDYMDAIELAEGFKEAIDDMPSVNRLTLQDKEDLSIIVKAYNSLTSYQKSYIKKYYSESLQKMEDLVKKMNELVESAGGDSDDKIDPDKPEEDDKTEGADNEENKDDASKK